MNWLACSALLLLVGPLVSMQTQAQVSRVRDTVVVHGKNILLSDLLDSVDAGLTAAARAIDLGRSPLPGSIRVLRGEQIAQRLSADSRFQTLRIPDRVIVSDPGWAISRQALWTVVAKNLRERGWAEDQLPEPEALRWPATVRTLEPASPLQVTSAQWSAAQHTLQISARCTSASECRSFLVQAQITRDLPARPTHSGELGKVTAVAGARVKSAPATPMAIPGKRALLILESAGIRVSLPVTPLQRGTVGQKIRVREWNGHRIYDAAVVGPGVLHASL